MTNISFLWETQKQFNQNSDDGKQVYEIEMLTKRGEVELEIDANTGKIISVDFDD